MMAKPLNQSGEQAFEIARQAAEQDIQATFDAEIEQELNLDDPESLEAELQMEEVNLDQAELESIAADNVDDPADEDGIEPAAEQTDDHPQALTESYGTGLKGQPSDRAGRYSRRNSSSRYNEASSVLTGGDIDANYEQANAVGDEAVGGTAPTPDQDIVDELGAAVGIEMDDRAFLRTEEMLVQRDDQRWELDPTSSEDYEDRRE